MVQHEVGAFASTGSLTEDLQATTAVHPMRIAAVEALLTSKGADMTVVDALGARGEVVRTRYLDAESPVRRLRRRSPTGS